MDAPDHVARGQGTLKTLRDRMRADALRTKFRAASGEMTEAQVGGAASCHLTRAHNSANARQPNQRTE